MLRTQRGKIRKAIGERVLQILAEPPSASNDYSALRELGSLAMAVDDLDYRFTHTSGANSTASEKKAKPNPKKVKKVKS